MGEKALAKGKSAFFPGSFQHHSFLYAFRYSMGRLAIGSWSQASAGLNSPPTSFALDESLSKHLKEHSATLEALLNISVSDPTDKRALKVHLTHFKLVSLLFRS